MESMINYKRELYTEYEFHLKGIRDYLFKSEYVRKFVKDAVYRIFHIEVADLYFKDLDTIYESYFYVKELPDEVGNDIRYLGDIVLYQEEPDKMRIKEITLNMQNHYPNLYRKYNTLIIKAKDRVRL